ncbi:MAG TPA: R3H domain-containing nucleic acid-binding protein [Kofleriaceae bacterium]|nr:R3H domain-containing nucleic acid-binding protein [Kofleriaceae bacterium]
MEAAETSAPNTTNREDLAEKASDFLLGLLERMGISADIDVKDDNDRTVLEIQTADTELVIGRRGVVIDALQHLVNKAVFKERSGEKGKPLVVDAGGFRDKQVERLRGIAQKMAEKALQTKQIVELQPMSPHDRRIVHMAIAEIEGLSSRSEGEGEDRHILLVPASASAEA